MSPGHSPGSWKMYTRFLKAGILYAKPSSRKLLRAILSTGSWSTETLYPLGSARAAALLC